MASLTPEQRDILVKTILGEARGEGEEGMAAVAHVIANRANSGRYPGDPARVAQQPQQFSTWNRGEGGNNPQQFRPGTSQYDTAAQVIDRVFGGQSQDPTNGALFYHTPAVNPNWSREANRYGTTQLGNHIFYNGRPVPPREIPGAGQVATQIDVRRPVTGSPQTMPASLGAQRQLTAQLSGGQQSAPDASFYNGIFSQKPRQTPSSASVNNTVRSTQAAQMPLLANSLEQYAQQQAFRTPVSTQAVAQVPTRPQAQMRQPNAAEKAAINYVPPPRSQLPPVAPSNTASPRVFSETAARTAAATQPALQSALERLAAPKPMNAAQQRADNGQTRPTARTVPSSVVNESIARAQAATNPALQSALANRAAPVATASLNAPTMTSAQRSALSSVGGVGQPPATRVVPSVPWGQPAIPGPNAVPKDQSRLTPQGGLPIAASAAPPSPPIMVAGAAPARQSVTGFPTPASQRPTGGIFAQSAPLARPVANMPLMGMPTAAPAARPVARPALNVTVQGARTQQPSSAPSTPRYQHKGVEVYATPTKHYNASTNQFENVTTYKPR